VGDGAGQLASGRLDAVQRQRAVALAGLLAGALEVFALVAAIARRTLGRRGGQFGEAADLDALDLALDQLFDVGQPLLSSGANSEVASPCLPARPVRPMRCT
jgi:hypothetical protein